ncbi:fasciclin domain-containing protein [Anabaena azotica]|uniref:Fasciclin domain-containing protein n=1 Tax=Anabaena azotica FACHB-119 TaxID=947527 RepID=A0ABR8D575_9NOST|nr:fasciclin domain-containing protein [Anabaena azotica]MBD2502337.1 fasciclin domain-containing protein [Anabaena azotica FACHB-119]
MRVNQSKLLTNLASVVSLAGVSLLITLPSIAREVLNPNPTIFQEAPYNRSQPNQTNVSQLTKNNNKQQIAQSGSGTTNPRPSIFNEPPYNRGSRTPPTETSPATNSTPQTPGTTAPPQGTPQKIPPTIPPQGTTNTQNKTLLALLESNSSFTTLTKAIKAAGLADTLQQGDKSFTVFAPTDAAFAELPQDAVMDLFKPENKEVLVKLLTYHVVPGAVLSTDLKSGQLQSVEGGPIAVKVDPGKSVGVNDATVVQADIKASNGVVHGINKVILPPDL